MWLLWNLFDLAGTLSFAVSGAIVGAVKRMDIFGISVLAILTAVGGGMIRDVMAGHGQHETLLQPRDLGAERLQQLRHRGDVRQARRIGQGQRLVRQKRRGHQRQAGVLGPRNRDRAIQRPVAAHQNRIHLPASLLFLLVRVAGLAVGIFCHIRSRPRPGLRLAPGHVGLQRRLAPVLAAGRGRLLPPRWRQKAGPSKD